MPNVTKKVSEWLFELIKPHIEPFVASIVKHMCEDSKQELYEISALQKRDIRQYIFERVTAMHGFLNPSTIFEPNGVYFEYGGIESRKRVKIFDAYKNFYTQDDIVKLIENFENYISTHQKLNQP